MIWRCNGRIGVGAVLCEVSNFCRGCLFSLLQLHNCKPAGTSSNWALTVCSTHPLEQRLVISHHSHHQSCIHISLFIDKWSHYPQILIFLSSSKANKAA
ncbi:hypothetical protein GN956_G9037 [Arapaima gigas]